MEEADHEKCGTISESTGGPLPGAGMARKRDTEGARMVQRGFKGRKPGPGGAHGGGGKDRDVQSPGGNGL